MTLTNCNALVVPETCENHNKHHLRNCIRTMHQALEFSDYGAQLCLKWAFLNEGVTIYRHCVLLGQRSILVRLLHNMRVHHPFQP